MSANCIQLENMDEITSSSSVTENEQGKDQLNHFKDELIKEI